MKPSRAANVSITIAILFIAVVFTELKYSGESLALDADPGRSNTEIAEAELGPTGHRAELGSSANVPQQNRESLTLRIRCFIQAGSEFEALAEAELNVFGQSEENGDSVLLASTGTSGVGVARVQIEECEWIRIEGLAPGATAERVLSWDLLMGQNEFGEVSIRLDFFRKAAHLNVRLNVQDSSLVGWHSVTLFNRKPPAHFDALQSSDSCSRREFLGRVGDIHHELNCPALSEVYVGVHGDDGSLLAESGPLGPLPAGEVEEVHLLIQQAASTREIYMRILGVPDQSEPWLRWRPGYGGALRELELHSVAGHSDIYSTDLPEHEAPAILLVGAGTSFASGEFLTDLESGLSTAAPYEVHLELLPEFELGPEWDAGPVKLDEKGHAVAISELWQAYPLTVGSPNALGLRTVSGIRPAGLLAVHLGGHSVDVPWVDSPTGHIPAPVDFESTIETELVIRRKGVAGEATLLAIESRGLAHLVVKLRGKEGAALRYTTSLPQGQVRFSLARLGQPFLIWQDAIIGFDSTRHELVFSDFLMD